VVSQSVTKNSIAERVSRDSVPQHAGLRVRCSRLTVRLTIVLRNYCIVRVSRIMDRMIGIHDSRREPCGQHGDGDNLRKRSIYLAVPCTAALVATHRRLATTTPDRGLGDELLLTIVISMHSLYILLFARAAWNEKGQSPCMRTSNHVFANGTHASCHPSQTRHVRDGIVLSCRLYSRRHPVRAPQASPRCV
jgi:hypothetical protein